MSKAPAPPPPPPRDAGNSRAWGYALPVLLAAIVLMRLGTCLARQRAADERKPLAQSAADLRPGPEATCEIDCAAALNPFGKTPEPDPAAKTTCQRACVQVKTRQPSADFPTTYRRCEVTCVFGLGLKQRREEKANPEADAGPDALPESVKAACVDRCLVSVGNGKEFNPQAP